MEKRKAVKLLTAVCVALALLIGAGTARADESNVIVMTPGNNVGRTFYLDDQDNSYNANNGALFLVLAAGGKIANIPGVLTITVSNSASTTTGAILDYACAGAAYAYGATKPVFVTPLTASAANKITQTVTFNAQFGVAMVFVWITDVTPDLVVHPMPFSINFALAAKK